MKEGALRSWLLIVLLACSSDLEPVVDDAVTDDAGVEDSGATFESRRVPPGMVAFYETKGCPEGWSTLDAASGRALVAAPDVRGVGTTVGAPLSDHVPDSHTHTVSGEAPIPSAGLAGVQGCCTSTPAENGVVLLEGSGDARESRLPTIALQVCVREGDTAWSPGALDPFPSGAAAFFMRPSCPEGWSRLEQARGRLVAGLTMFGDPLETTGRPLEDGEQRTHAHAVTGTVEVPVAAIAGASGGTVYAASGAHPVTGETDEGTSGLPYLQALFCGKE